MIKRKRNSLICLGIMFILSACSSPEGSIEENIADDGISGIKPPEGCEIVENTEDFESVTDDQNFNEKTDMRTSVYFANIAIAEDGLYLNNNDLLIYYDKKTGNSDLLCGKPDCEHISEDCNGYVMSSSYIQYYNGDLYTVKNYYSLVKISTDGTVRENLGKLNISGDLNGGSINWYIHRGYIYYWYASGTSIGNDETYYINGSNCIYRKALDKNSEPECIMALPIEKVSASHRIVGVGSYVYIIIDEAGIYRYNTESNKIEWFKDLGNVMRGAAIYDNKIYYAQFYEDKEKTIIYSYNIESNKKEVFLEIDKKVGISSWDEDFFYITYEYSENQWITEVINWKGEYVAKIPNWESVEASNCKAKYRMWAITDADRIYIISDIFLDSSDDNIYTPGIANAYSIIEYIEKEDLQDGEYKIKEWSEIKEAKE